MSRLFSIEHPALQSDRTRNVETLQKTRLHLLGFLQGLRVSLKVKSRKSQQILFTLLCTLRIRAVRPIERDRERGEKRKYTLKALVWR